MTDREKRRKQIYKLAKSILRENEIQVKDIPLGQDSVTYEIYSPKEKYILRTGAIRANYDVEHHILKLLAKEGVKVPEIIAESVDLNKYPFCFSMQRKAPGITLHDVSKKHWPRILAEVGSQLKIVHENKIPGYGVMDAQYFRRTGKLRGIGDSWYEYQVGKFEEKVSNILKKYGSDKKNNFSQSKLRKSQIEKLTEIVERLDEARRIMRLSKADLEIDKGSLLHGDIHFIHILVHQKKLSAILDFNKTYVGDPFYDVAYFSVMENGEYYPDMLKTTGLKFDGKKLRTYRLMISIGKLNIRYVQKNYLYRYSKILDVALGELNK